MFGFVVNKGKNMLCSKETLEKFGYTTESLSKGSNKKVITKCDYCGKTIEVIFKIRNKSNSIIDKDSCNKCKYEKRKEISIAQYGVSNSAKREDVRQKISENCAFNQEGFKEKRDATMIAKYGVINPMDSKELKDKHRQSIIDKYGVDNVSKVEEVQAKKRVTNLERYGNEQFLGSAIGREKVKQGVLEKYGVENVFQAEEIKQRIRETNLENLGVEMPTQSKDVLKKIESTNLYKYGCVNPAQNEEVKEKIKKTNIERYGYSNPQQAPEIKDKIRQKAIDNGRIILYDGKDMKTWAKELSVPYATFTYHTRTFGVEFALKATKHITLLEKIVQEWLDTEKINYKIHFVVSNRKSDFLLVDHNIILELDGLFWHSDRILSNDYHITKYNFYVENGYTPLFFREDEIYNKFDIVKSIIKNKIGQSNKIYARKCDIVNVSSSDSINFFKNNHLMGRGKGTSYGLLYNGELVSCIIIKNTVGKNYEISRFCNKLNTSVVGGFSRLINYFTNNNDVDCITTFIDRRYGAGEYLNDLGFTFVNCEPSFRWTNTKECFYRMKFPGDSGYEKGFLKIWDCGQARYDKTIQHK